VLGIACVPLFDASILQMLRGALTSSGLALDVVEAPSRAEALAQVAERQPKLVCIAGLPPAGNANARFLCRRLRASFPGTFIVALVPQAADKHSQETAARLREAGANSVVHSVAEAAQALAEHQPAEVTVSSASVAFAG
jgi:DNA-binding response OmpR family regulator